MHNKYVRTFLCRKNYEPSNKVNSAHMIIHESGNMTGLRNREYFYSSVKDNYYAFIYLC